MLGVNPCHAVNLCYTRCAIQEGLIVCTLKQTKNRKKNYKSFESNILILKANITKSPFLNLYHVFFLLKHMFLSSKKYSPQWFLKYLGQWSAIVWTTQSTKKGIKLIIFHLLFHEQYKTFLSSFFFSMKRYITYISLYIMHVRALKI